MNGAGATSASAMRAIVIDGRGGVDLVEKAVPAPSEDEVLISPRAVGVCGTDLHLIAGTFPLARYPVTPGHEFAGVVTAVGRAVTRVREGDLVCVDPNVSCGLCSRCRDGVPNHCPQLDPLGLTRDGACAEFVTAPAANVFALPAGVSPHVGALIEPLSCVIHAARRTPGWPDARVAVFGAGPIGLLAVAVALHRGAASVVAFEPHTGRRAAAVVVGAEEAYAGVAEMDTLFDFDIAIEASGHTAAIRDAMGCLGPLGRLVQMGAANPEARIEVSPHEVFAKELMIIGSFSVADAYAEAVETMPDLASSIASLITERVPLSQYRQGLERLNAPTNIKMLVVPD